MNELIPRDGNRENQANNNQLDSNPKYQSNSQYPARNSDQIHCFSCAKILHATSKYCPSCGAEQPQNANTQSQERSNYISNKMYCRGCGAAIHSSAGSCPSCGALQELKTKGRKSRGVAILLAIILGWMGGHKFYLDQFGWGIIYLVFFWTFIPAIVGILEALVYLSHSDEEFATVYG